MGFDNFQRQNQIDFLLNLEFDWEGVDLFQFHVKNIVVNGAGLLYTVELTIIVELDFKLFEILVQRVEIEIKLVFRHSIIKFKFMTESINIYNLFYYYETYYGSPIY